MKFRQHDNTFIELQDISNLNALCLKVKEWNGLSLIGKSTENDMFFWHINDALSIVNLLKNETAEIIDFGAGSGIIGSALIECGIKKINFVERSQVKLNFIKNILKHENAYLNFDFLKTKCSESDSQCILIVKGVSDIDEIVQIVIKNTLNVKKIIFFKANDYSYEIKKASKLINFSYEIFQRASVPGKIIVIDF